MQTVIHVVCKGTKSLRDLISRDKHLKDHRLQLLHSKRKSRSPGWAKLNSTVQEPGAINLVWDVASRTLTCRVVTKKSNNPHKIVGDIIGYLMARHSSRIVTIAIYRVK